MNPLIDPGSASITRCAASRLSNAAKTQLPRTRHARISMLPQPLEMLADDGDNGR